MRKRRFKSRHTLAPEILLIGWRLKAGLMTPLCNHYLSGKDSLTRTPPLEMLLDMNGELQCIRLCGIAELTVKLFRLTRPSISEQETSKLPLQFTGPAVTMPRSHRTRDFDFPMLRKARSYFFSLGTLPCYGLSVQFRPTKLRPQIGVLIFLGFIFSLYHTLIATLGSKYGFPPTLLIIVV